MKALTFFLYYYGTVASLVIVAEATVYINEGHFFNPITNPGVTVPAMILAALMLILPTIYYKFIKPMNELEETT